MDHVETKVFKLTANCIKVTIMIILNQNKPTIFSGRQLQFGIIINFI